MNFHISRWPPLRPKFSASSLSSAQNRHEDPTDTNHDTVTYHHNHHHPATSPGPVTIEVDGVDTSDDDDRRTHRKLHSLATNGGAGSFAHGGGSDTEGISTTESDSDISADDVTQDSRDVLVQRLTDLADKLSEGNVRTSSIEALHKQVDEMERVLRRGGSRARSVSRHSHASSSSRRAGGAAAAQGGRGSLRPGSRPRSLQFATASGAGGMAATTSGGELSPAGRDALGIRGATPMSPSWFVSQFQRRPSMHFQEKVREGGMSLPSPTPLAVAGVDKQQAGLSPPPQMDLGSSKRTSPQSQRQQDIEAPPRSIEHEVQQQVGIHAAETSPPPSEISSEVAETVVLEAEKLCAEMATVIESLQSRRQESDHLYQILVHRNQLLHQRCLQHEQQQQRQKQTARTQTQAQEDTAALVNDLEELLADHEADLRHLKIDLRAIEAQCMGYVPKGADPALEESIRRWRQDWAELRDKFATTRKKTKTSRPGLLGGDGRRVTSLTLSAASASSSSFISGRRSAGEGDEYDESNSSISGLTSPMSLR